MRKSFPSVRTVINLMQTDKSNTEYGHFFIYSFASAVEVGEKVMKVGRKSAYIILAAVFILASAGCSRFSGNEKSAEEAAAIGPVAESIPKALRDVGEQGKEQIERLEETSGEGEGQTESARKKGILIAIDPGHQSPEIDMSGLEENAPGSGVLKMKASSGTTGAYTGIPEYALNLDLSLMLREELENRGYDVLLTRENNETAISNAERAQMANGAGADIAVRIHANGSEDPGASGALVLTGSAENPYVGNLYEASAELGNAVLDSYCAATGMENLGVQENDTMTGINWSEIPVIILEMGFMTNEQDDRNMADEQFREKMVSGISDGIDTYYEKKGLPGLEEEIYTQIQREEEQGAIVSVYAERIDTGAKTEVNITLLESASLIKLYIAGCVYENYEAVKSQESYEGETKTLIEKMLSASDNNAANTLVVRLGSDSAEAGIAAVNAFCANHGYDDTSMGRLMLDFSTVADNYTSARDCGKFLRDIYQGSLAGSEEILTCLKEQERVGKIPAGVPSDVVTANKTGELDDVENDAAIVYGENGAYILCVMMNRLQDTAAGRETIVQLSETVYEYMSGY